jgi:HlyB family type I secretion system ABC transporter
MSLIVNQLKDQSLFQGVDDAVIGALAAAAQPVTLAMGQAFQRAGQLAPGAALVLDGRLRRLDQSPGGLPISLGFVDAGSWVGWSSLWRGEPELMLTASQPSRLLLLPAEAVREALQRSGALREALLTVGPEELMAVLLPHWQRDGKRFEQPRRALEHLEGHGRVLRPGDVARDDEVLLLSGPVPEGAEGPGSPVAAVDAIWNRRVDGLPVRVLALPKARLAEAEQRAQGPDSSALAVISSQETLPTPPAARGGRSLRRDNVSFAPPGGVNSRVEEAVTCVLHLARARRVAFSEEMVRANFQEVEKRLGALGLPQVGLQLEALGFDTRPLQARPWDLARLEPPALIDLDGHFVLVLATGRGGGVLVGDPRRGLQRLSLQRLEELAGDGLPVLVVREGRTSPSTEGFGFGWFVPALMRYPWLLVLTLVTSFTVQLLQVVEPLGLMLMFDAVLGRNNPSLLWPVTAVLVMAVLASGILGALKALITADLSDRVDVRLGSAVVEHLLRLPLPYFEERQVGAILHNVNKLYELRRFLLDQVLGVGLDMIFASVFLLVLFILSPMLAFVVLGVVPLLILLNVLSTPVLRQQILRSNHFGSRAGSFLVEVLSGMRTVKSQNFEVEARWEWLNRYRSYTEARFRLTRFSNLVEALARTIKGLGSTIVMVVGISLALDSKISVGAVMAARLLDDRVIGPLLRLSSLWQGVQEMRIAIDCIGQIMLATPEVGDDDLQALPPPPIRGQVTFEDVSFRYGNRGPLQLDGLSLTIEPGQFVGIVGLSGSGKSTMVQLIDRLYRPREGRIYLDGVDIEKLQLAGLRQRIGYVPQDSLLFEGTVLDNLRLNNPEADMGAVVEATTVACAHEFIVGLDKGYATRLGERGAGLSGGQRQRVSLARTILQSPSLLILDEATSALDADTEAQICRNLLQRFRGTTVLYITHRLTTLQGADRILFMEKGRIIEDGNHADLCRLGGAYATLFQQQVSGAAIA